MLAEQHIRTGVVGGLALMAVGANAVGAAPLIDLLMVPAVAGGAALLPDWDHHGSTVTRFFPLLTRPVYWITKWVHRILYSMTRGRFDPPNRRGDKWRTHHRGTTHSLVLAVAIVPVLALVFYTTPPWVVIGFILFMVLLAGDVVFAPILLIVYAVAGLHAYGALGLVDHVFSLGWLWAVAIGLGCVMHILGDCPTTQGAPLWAPFSWQPVVLPFSFKTGGPFEMRVVRVVLALAIVYLEWILHGQWIGDLLGKVTHLAG